MTSSDLWRGHDLAELVAGGCTTNDIAEISGMTGSAVRSALRRRGLSAPLPSIETVRDVSEQMKPAEAYEYVLGVLEQIAPWLLGGEHEIDTWGLSLTPNQRLILAALVSASPRVVTQDQLRDLCDLTKCEGDFGGRRTIQVQIVRIRKVLKPEFGTVCTIWGRGYSFVRAQR